MQIVKANDHRLRNGILVGMFIMGAIFAVYLWAPWLIVLAWESVLAGGSWFIAFVMAGLPQFATGFIIAAVSSALLFKGFLSALFFGAKRGVTARANPSPPPQNQSIILVKEQEAQAAAETALAKE